MFKAWLTIWGVALLTSMSNGIDFKHHNYGEMQAYLQQIHKRCPNITRMYSIGHTIQGRELTVMEITENPGKFVSLKPNFKYVGNMHGNEV